jgi:hypothetical protein
MNANTMNANDVIEAYVTEVAVRLPRRQRNDVAFELRALLHEELQARADAAGRGADAGMATGLLQGFGHPAEVAARYRPQVTIIDPVDGHAFLRATFIGLAIIWCAGLFAVLRQPLVPDAGLLQAIGQWWVGTVIPSLWWPGVLVAGYGIAAWTRRRWPHRTPAWKPRAADRIPGSRASLVLGILGILCGVFVLHEPRWVLDAFFDGHAAPAAYDALTYTDTFRQRQAPWLFALLLLNVPLLGAVIVGGRWSPLLRRCSDALGLALCIAMAWTALDGPVFMAQASDEAFKGTLWLIIAFTLVGMAIKWQRGVRPAPN